MQIAAEVRKIYFCITNQKKAIELKDMKINYGKEERTTEQKQADLERATALSKARWGSRLKGFKRVQDSDGNGN